MKKVMLAVGFVELENYLQRKLKNEFLFVGLTTYREGILRNMRASNPDIIVIREGLGGQENILKIVYEIRINFPHVRVVYVSGKREPGDALLADLVSRGIYDVLYGEKIRSDDIVALIRNPNEYKDVQHLQPKPILDEKTNKVLFEAPNVPIKEVSKAPIKELVFIEAEKSGKSDKGVTEQHEESRDSKSPEPKITPVVELHKEDDDVQDTKASPSLAPKQASPQSEPSKRESPKGKFWDKVFSGTGGSEYLIEPVDGKQKILTFLGSKPGVGNTSIAINVATQLAQKKKRVMFIEFNDRTPAVNYWYEMGHMAEGIETALNGLQANDIKKVDQAIVRVSTLVKQESSLQKNYKKLPQTLDFLFFSKRYLARKAGEFHDVPFALTKDLYMHLLFQLDYDYIVIDVQSNLESEATLNALQYASKVFITVSQDVSSIGNAVYIIKELTKENEAFTKKIDFIINRYEKAELDEKEILDWIEMKSAFLMPSLNTEFVNANFVGLPVLLYTKNAQLKQSFQKIEKHILTGGAFN